MLRMNLHATTCVWTPHTALALTQMPPLSHRSPPYTQQDHPINKTMRFEILRALDAEAGRRVRWSTAWNRTSGEVAPLTGTDSRVVNLNGLHKLSNCSAAETALRCLEVFSEAGRSLCGVWSNATTKIYHNPNERPCLRTAQIAADICGEPFQLMR